MLRLAFDWVNVYLAVPVGLVGFGLAIWQAVEAKRAANRATTAADAAKDAAQEASKSTREQFRLMSASSLLPQLIRLEEAIDFAVERKSTELLAHVISNWRWQSGMCREFLDESRPQEATIMTNIQKSILAVKALKQEVPHFDDQTDWADITSRVRKTIGDVTADLGSLAAHQSVKESS